MKHFLLIALLAGAVTSLPLASASAQTARRTPPPRRVQAVNESGAPLFGTNAGNVAVTNFPPATSPAPTVFTVYGATTCPTGATALYAGSVLGEFTQTSGVQGATMDGQCWQNVPPDFSNSREGFFIQFWPVATCVVCRW